ncbi:hypothetical protein FE257_011878 [Aspergillus nanangensis]|uniref:Uncharacterized protein n=1 Tax=Aspergillus nanangensis TaxID=2582783 RepID=A0AAD4CGV9_ASPNN|nr:hypothetical protein FE257_011878 [Aspergillus nanangensis]
MSTLSAGDAQSTMPSDAQMKREAVPELVQLFQAQSASSATQGNGARDIFKAGHRRLRQLAQRQKKASDPRAKAEEASRQLLALQEEGFLPTSKAKRTAAKTSIDSTFSSSQSASNLSFKSTSRRDVESIGQPWLGDPLDRLHSHEPIGTQLSSLDLRDLTSFVEAAVSLPPQLDDVTPPPYQPSPHPEPALVNQGPEKLPVGKTSHESTGSEKQPLGRVEDVSSLPNHANRANPMDTTEDKKPGPLSVEEKQHSEAKQSEEGRRSVSAETQSSAVSSKSAAYSTPSSQSLKLFPDNLPPRVSSKAAWRISGVRPPGANRPQPTTGSPSVAVASGNTKTQTSGDGAPKTQVSDIPQPANRSLTNTPTYDRFPQHRSSRRPASLPLGSIHSFPLPAPMRPLPSLPEPVAGINTNHGPHIPANTQISSTKRRPGLQPPFSSGGDKSNTNCNNPDHSEMTPRPDTPSKILDGKQAGSTQKATSSKTNEPIQLGITPFVRTGKSRADRVRALKMKDMSASRIYLTGAENPPQGEQGQPSDSQSLSQKTEEVPSHTLSHGDGDKPSMNGPPKLTTELVSSPLSPPCLKLHHRSSNQQLAGQRSCSSPTRSTPACPGSDEGCSSLPASSRSSHISRCSSCRSSDAAADTKGLSVPPQYTRAETPIPSSDDECMGRSGKLRHPSQPVPKRRRHRPAAIVVGDHGARKMRSATKLSSHGHHRGPTTPRKVRSGGFDRLSPQSQHSQSTYVSQESLHNNHRSYVAGLEGRIAHLERQNKVLQAALLAALDLGDKPTLETLLSGSASSLSTPDTGRSFSSTTNPSSVDEPAGRDERYTRTTKSRIPYQPQNWIASPGSSRSSSYSSEDSDHVRELEDMIEDFDFSWVSDKSSLERPQRVGYRA